MKLVEAFWKGKPVDWSFMPWNDVTTAPKLSQATWNDTRAEILEAVLANLPKSDNLKKRMDVAQKITDRVMGVVGKAWTNE